MEFTGNNEYASKGVGTAGLTLGIIGTALATLAGGGSLLNANNRSNGNGNGGTPAAPITPMKPANFAVRSPNWRRRSTRIMPRSISVTGLRR